MNRVAFSISGFPVYWYGIIYSLSIFIFIYFFRNIFNKKYNKNKSIKEGEINAFLLELFLYSIIFSRLFHCVIYNFDYFSNNLLDIFNFRTGGLSFFGGLIGMALCIYFNKSFLLRGISEALLKTQTKSNKRRQSGKTSFFLISDISVSSSYTSIFLMRVANFINGEITGKPIEILQESDSVISKIIFKAYKFFNKSDELINDITIRHPSQIYEAIFESIVPFLLILIIKKYFKKNNKTFYAGLKTLLFLLFYSAGRFVCEFYKDEYEIILFNLNINQIFSIILAISSLIVLQQTKSQSSV